MIGNSAFQLWFTLLQKRIVLEPGRNKRVNDKSRRYQFKELNHSTHLRIALFRLGNSIPTMSLSSTIFRPHRLAYVPSNCFDHIQTPNHLRTINPENLLFLISLPLDLWFRLLYIAIHVNFRVMVILITWYMVLSTMDISFLAVFLWTKCYDRSSVFLFTSQKLKKLLVLDPISIAPRYQSGWR